MIYKILGTDCMKVLSKLEINSYDSQYQVYFIYKNGGFKY